MPSIGRTAAALLALVLLAPLAAGDASAGVVIREKTSYYKVSGRTGAAIYDQIEKKGPRIRGRKEHFVATATFDFHFDAKKIKAATFGSQCRVTAAEIVLTVTYRVPQWVDERQGSQTLQRAWKQFVDFVWQHEKRHTEIARDAAYQMIRALKSVRGDANRECAGITNGLDEKIAAIAKRHNKRQEDFDASPWGIGGKVFHFDHKLMAAK